MSTRNYQMPDLSGLNSKVILDLVLNVVLGAFGPKDPQAAMLVNTYVRLVDKTVLEYESARAALLEYANRQRNNTTSPLFRAVGDLEACIITMKRAIRLAERIRRHQSIRANVSGKVLKQIDAGITPIRDAIEHADEHIMKGIPVGIRVNSDSFEIEGKTVKFADLADWIRDLNTLASDLAKYHEP